MLKAKMLLSMATALSLACAMFLGGCGSDVARRPPQAAVFRPTAPPARHNWTTGDKIAAINRAPMSADQKREEIAKVQAGQD